MNGFIKILSLTVFALLVSGCKLAVMVPSEGNVVSSSGLRDCAGPRYCEFDITDDSFSETFTAVPRPGFEFVRWQDGGGFICAKSTDPACTVEMPNALVGAAVVALFNTGLIKPVFSTPGGVDTDGDGMINEIDDDDDNDGAQDAFDSCPLDGPNNDGDGCPYLQTSQAVRVYDKLWAQPSLFWGVTWYEVKAACPGPTGACSGKLGDYDVTGWTWASGAEVTSLLNDFLGTALGTVPDFVYEPEGWDLSPNIFNYFGAFEDCCTYHSLYGWLREQANVVEGYHYGVGCSDLNDNHCQSFRAGGQTNGISTVEPIPKFESRPNVGVWLHRPVP
jgi:hypothetical protein